MRSASVYVFVGPSLGLDEARRELDAVYLPPVSQGDVYRVARNRPWAIGIIDGYFDRVPAVWHKEILWAMSEGIHVYGSASMGALRAAELAAFGMEGVGDVFARYRDGVFEDDDEVAVIHGTAEHGYVAMSDAMVNIRFTLASAVAAGVIDESIECALVGLAKKVFYPHRTFQRLLGDAAAVGLPGRDLRALERWLPQGRVDQKRADAQSMLKAIRVHRERDASPKRATFVLEHSPYSIRAAHEAGEYKVSADGDHRAILLPALLDELRLEPGALARAFDGALLRHLLLLEAGRRGMTAGDATDLVAQLRQLLVRDARGAMADHLKSIGEFDRYAARAMQKEALLDADGGPSPGEPETNMTPRALVEWHFKRLSQPVPANLTEYAGGLGVSVADFIRVLYREYRFVQLAADGAAGITSITN